MLPPDTKGLSDIHPLIHPLIHSSIFNYSLYAPVAHLRLSETVPSNGNKLSEAFRRKRLTNGLYYDQVCEYLESCDPSPVDASAK